MVMNVVLDIRIVLDSEIHYNCVSVMNIVLKDVAYNNLKVFFNYLEFSVILSDSSSFRKP